MILIGLTASQSRSMTGASCRRHQLVSSLPNNGCSQKRGDVDQTFRGAKVYISQIFYRHPHSTNLEASLRIWPASGVADWVRFAPNPPSAPQHRDTRSTNRNQLRLLESGHRGSFRPSHAFDLLVSGLGRDVRFFGGCEAEEGRGKRDEDMCIRKGVHSFLRDILQVLDLILLKCPSALPCAKQKLMEVAGSITRHIHPLMLFFNSNIKSLERLQLLLPATRTGPLSSSLSLSLFSAKSAPRPMRRIASSGTPSRCPVFHRAVRVARCRRVFSSHGDRPGSRRTGRREPRCRRVSRCSVVGLRWGWQEDGRGHTPTQAT